MYNLSIKNMVCGRCIKVVKDELLNLGLKVIDVNLGYAQLDKKPGKPMHDKIANVLSANGFELLDEKGAKIIEQIKNLIVESIHHSASQPKTNYSDFIADHLHHDYSYVSNLFSQVEGLTIEQYIINQKIEKVKELLVYDELSLSQIAIQLGYSSTAHLSSQFKKLTGLTPSAFKQNGIQNRRSLDDIGKPE